MLSGGQSLIPAMNLRLIAPELTVDIGELAELRGIEVKGVDVSQVPDGGGDHGSPWSQPMRLVGTWDGQALTLTEDVIRVSTNPMFPDEGPGTRIVNSESFTTRNDFYGGQLGLVNEFHRDRWTLDLRSTVALGGTHQELRIDGSQVRTIPGMAPQTFVGGLLALPSNIGVHSRDVFSVVPEVGLTVGYQLTDHLKTFVGYNFLYWKL